ncbi:hypothetical protein BDN71DRAFT_1504794 [Pleurotus eryngii]|uniref:Heterokaryon incompatibility domain-containing protein n=1 Tax=Pleurotus eryngii TaxID=5323 RepID=A0A9P6A075_PLEER|nr:hypothetical protein BDN71DRAFT_1504794 [Pleurotus eryngii]
MKWIKIPLTCSKVMNIISYFPLPDYGPGTTLAGWKDEIRPYVVSAMAKNLVIEGDEAYFISTLNDELQAYDSMPRDHMAQHMHWPPRISVHPILLELALHVSSLESERDDPSRVCEGLLLSHTRVTAKKRLFLHILLSACDLINAKRKQQTSIPSHLVPEQFALLGQYAILSHRWCPDGQELSFTDVTNFSAPNVQAKEGFKKLTGFAEVVQSHFRCRYLWVDRACICESDRAASISLMFGWYRSAYVCAIYLSTSPTV